MNTNGTTQLMLVSDNSIVLMVQKYRVFDGTNLCCSGKNPDFSSINEFSTYEGLGLRMMSMERVHDPSFYSGN